MVARAVEHRVSAVLAESMMLLRAAFVLRLGLDKYMQKDDQRVNGALEPGRHAFS